MQSFSRLPARLSALFVLVLSGCDGLSLGDSGGSEAQCSPIEIVSITDTSRVPDDFDRSLDALLASSRKLHGELELYSGEHVPVTVEMEVEPGSLDLEKMDPGHSACQSRIVGSMNVKLDAGDTLHGRVTGELYVYSKDDGVSVRSGWNELDTLQTNQPEPEFDRELVNGPAFQVYVTRKSEDRYELLVTYIAHVEPEPCNPGRDTCGGGAGGFEPVYRSFAEASLRAD